MKTASCISRRSARLAVYLAAGICWGVAAFSCSSGSGSGGSRTEDLPPVVFLASKEDPNIVELFVSLTGGADIKKLSGAMAAGGNVVDFMVAPDGLQVAYVADQRTDGRFELFVSPVDGSAPPAVPVSGSMAGTGIAAEIANPDRYSFAWSTDGQRIAYRATQSLADAVELYTVRSNGADNVKLHTDFATGQNVDAFAWAPDASRVAYTANQFPPPPATATIELYTSSPSGSTDNIRVSGDLVSDGNVDRFIWAPNSGRIAYRADQIIDEMFELFVTRPNQEFDVQVSLPLIEPGDVRINFAWAPDSSRIAYRANFVNEVLFVSDKLGLYTGRPDGTEKTRVSGGMQPAAAGVRSFQWAPDSSLLTYVADQVKVDQFDLFVTTPDIATPLPAKISLFDVTVIDGEVTSSSWSPNSNRIAFIADLNFFGFSELFTAYRTGTGIPLLISNLADPQGDVESLAWSPDSSLIAFRADQDVDGVIELYTAPPTGTVSYTISDVAATGGQVQQYLWEPGGEGIGYIADQETAGRFELYLSLPDGRDQTKVSGPLVAGGDVMRFAWVP